MYPSLGWCALGLSPALFQNQGSNHLPPTISFQLGASKAFMEIHALLLAMHLILRVGGHVKLVVMAA
jgi:hypothetical protein